MTSQIDDQWLYLSNVKSHTKVIIFCLVCIHVHSKSMLQSTGWLKNWQDYNIQYIYTTITSTLNCTYYPFIFCIFHYTVVFKNPVEDKFSSVAVRYELLGLIHRRGLIGKLNLTRTFSCASLSRQYKQHYHITVQYRL